jgi:hypothetical protein
VLSRDAAARLAARHSSGTMTLIVPNHLVGRGVSEIGIVNGEFSR